jgi:hypothetical protein
MIGPSLHRGRADAAAREAVSAAGAQIQIRCTTSARWWASMADAEEGGDVEELKRLSAGIYIFEQYALR